MSALLTPARSPKGKGFEGQAPGGGPTLEQVLDSAWRQLQAGLPATCAVCGGRMEPEPGAPGRCGDCGARLR